MSNNAKQTEPWTTKVTSSIQNFIYPSKEKSDNPKKLDPETDPYLIWLKKKNPQPHRCAGHLNELLAAFETFPWEIKGPWDTFWKCHFSNPDEPLPPFYVRKKPIEYKIGIPPKDLPSSSSTN